MSDSPKKERVMSPKGFLHKATTKAALKPADFIATHRPWLETGELSKLTKPILEQLDGRMTFPTPALESLKAVVLGYHMATQVAKGQVAMAKKGEAKPPKAWAATIYTKDGEIAVRIKEKDGVSEEEELQQEFDTPQEADRWTDRRLVAGETNWFGVVNHTSQTNKDGDLISTVVTREAAMSRAFKQGAGPVTKSQAKSAGKLSWGVKSRPSVSKFSHG